MEKESSLMLYLSAAIAIVGAVGYQYFVKRVPASINPIISVLATYIAVLAFGLLLLPIFPAEGGIRTHLRQVNWIQIVLGISVIMIELGFLLMYRSGWNLSTGNTFTSVVVNLVLVGLGVGLLGENINAGKVAGIILSILGVVLISRG